jgi:hypothetical protein
MLFWKSSESGRIREFAHNFAGLPTNLRFQIIRIGLRNLSEKFSLNPGKSGLDDEHII